MKKIISLGLVRGLFWEVIGTVFGIGFRGFDPAF